MNRGLVVAVFAGAMSFMPGTATAQDHGSRSYTDNTHRDKHEWNTKEDDAWKRYRGEHHIKQEDFARAKRRQQQEYWNWRHEHPDER